MASRAKKNKKSKSAARRNIDQMHNANKLHNENRTHKTASTYKLRSNAARNTQASRGAKASAARSSEHVQKPRYGTVKGNFLEGRHALQEAYDADIPLRVIYASDAARKDSAILQLLSDFEENGTEIVRAKKAQLDARSSHGAHQGLVAKLAPYAYRQLHDLIVAAQDKENALIVACDHVTDAGNFGAICRSAEVVGACGVLISDKRCAQVTAATYKTSAGAIVHLPIAKETNLVRSLNALKEEGFWVVGASEHADQLAWDTELTGRIVLVMGSEDKGLSRLVQKSCDMLVALPQQGRIESLNVAQACTCLAYEWLRQTTNS